MKCFSEPGAAVFTWLTSAGFNLDKQNTGILKTRGHVVLSASWPHRMIVVMQQLPFTFIKLVLEDMIVTHINAQ